MGGKSVPESSKKQPPPSASKSAKAATNKSTGQHQANNTKKGRKRKNEEAIGDLSNLPLTATGELDSSNFTPTGRLKKKAKQAAGIVSGGGGGGGGAAGGGSSDDKKKAPRKPKRERPPPKSKEKAPVDVERQCGVALPNGGFCARSLTCKTHSMGAKRAVPGRSQPYDALLLAYQKRNQVKMASSATKQQLSLDNEALMEDTPLNEDEEFEQVMTGVMRARPVPLERRVVMPTRLRGDFFKMREMLIGALNNVPPAPSTESAAAAGTGGQQSINTVMAATGGVLGRTIVFDTVSGAQYVRPPRIFINNNTAAAQQQQQQNQNQGQNQTPGQQPQSQQQSPQQPQPQQLQQQRQSGSPSLQSQQNASPQNATRATLTPQQETMLRQRQMQMLQMRQQQQQQQHQQQHQQGNNANLQTINSTSQFPGANSKPQLPQAILQNQLKQ